jgi:hypothetical protein
MVCDAAFGRASAHVSKLTTTEPEDAGAVPFEFVAGLAMQSRLQSRAIVTRSLYSFDIGIVARSIVDENASSAIQLPLLLGLCCSN